MRKLLGADRKSAAAIVPNLAYQQEREGPNVTLQGRTTRDLDRSETVAVNRSCCTENSAEFVGRGGHEQASLGLYFIFSDGKHRQPSQHGTCLEKRQSQPWCPRCRRCYARCVLRNIPWTMAARSTTTFGRNLPTGRCPAQVDSQTRWQSAAPRHSKRGGPTDSTSHLASLDPDLRSDVFGIELRVSTPTIRTRSDQADSDHDPKRLSTLR